MRLRVTPGPAVRDRGGRSPRRWLVSALAAVIVLGGLAFMVASDNSGGASTLMSTDGFTALSTIGTVTPDTPYTSGQKIDIQVVANPVMNETNLAASSAPTTGNFYFAECTDPGGLAANLPTTSDGCEATTLNTHSPKSADGSAALTGINTFVVYNLPDPTTLGQPTMVGACDDGINPCVVGMFAANPSINGFSFPHLFSAPFYVSLGDELDLGDDPGDGSPLPTATTSATKSTVVAAPASVTANGVASSQITVTLKDANGTPVTSGKQVTLAPLSGSSVIKTGGASIATGTTSSSGQIVFSVSDLTNESVAYMATDESDDALPLVAEPTVTFVAPMVTAGNSTVVAQPSQVAAANGEDSSTITVTLNDQGSGGLPQPVANKVVSLSQGAGHSIITPATDMTNAQGQATFNVTDTTLESVTYAATDMTDGIPLTGQSAMVTFGTLLVSASASTVTTDTPILSSERNANGQPPSGTVTVTLVAGDGTSPVAGKSVTLSSSSSTAQVTPESAVTGTNGTATFSVNDPTSETVMFSAEDTSDTVAIATTLQVMFEAPVASASDSKLIVTPATVEADGITGASIVVTIKDQFGGPVAGKTVVVSGDITGAGTASTTLRVPPSTDSGGVVVTTTNAGGEITFLAYDTAAESITFKATDMTDSLMVAQTGSVTYTAGVPQVSESSVQASPAAIAANGSTASTITVTLADHNRNPVPNITVALASLNGSSVITPATDVTNAMGEATFEVTDQTAELVIYRATDTTDNLPLVGEEVTVTFGTPQPVAPVAADSAIVANTNTVAADGSSSATIIVFLNGSDGQPLTGKQVSLDPSSGSSSVAPSVGTTDSSGMASFAVTDKTPETVTYTVADVTDSVAFSGLSVSISFTAGSSSTTTTQPPANGTTTSQAGAGSSPTSGSQVRLGQPIVGMSATADGKGYWQVASDGGIANYGDAEFRGSVGGLNLATPIAGMAPLPNGKGYWLADANGQVYSFGNADPVGSAGALPLNKPIVGIAATPDGKGYWLVASDGGVFTYGDAVFMGSAGGSDLSSQIVGISSNPRAKGYWLVGADGDVFSFGDDTSYGPNAG